MGSNPDSVKGFVFWKSLFKFSGTSTLLSICISVQVVTCIAVFILYVADVSQIGLKNLSEREAT